MAAQETELLALETLERLAEEETRAEVEQAEEALAVAEKHQHSLNTSAAGVSRAQAEGGADMTSRLDVRGEEERGDEDGDEAMISAAMEVVKQVST